MKIFISFSCSIISLNVLELRTHIYLLFKKKVQLAVQYVELRILQATNCRSTFLRTFSNNSKHFISIFNFFLLFWFLVLFKLRFKIIWSPKSDPNRSLDGYRNMLERELGVCIMFIKLKCCGFTMLLVMTTSSNSTIHSGPMQELI